LPKRFVDEALWPQYLQLSKTLSAYLDEVTERVISESVHRDASDSTEVIAEKLLGPGGPAKD
jgi:tRNA nucleotidyltransferase (CCA-adding enzyme)